jgi:hypothetical protein
MVLAVTDGLGGVDILINAAARPNTGAVVGIDAFDDSEFSEQSTSRCSGRALPHGALGDRLAAAAGPQGPSAWVRQHRHARHYYYYGRDDTRKHASWVLYHSPENRHQEHSVT